MIKKQIQYKTTGKLTPEILNEVIKIERKDGLTAEGIIKQAENKSNPLHNLFDWDNTEAGDKWRLQQARVFINEIKIIVEDKEIFAFENVNVIVRNGNSNIKRKYKPIMEIMKSPDLRKQVIKSALDNLNYWQDKYSDYNEFKPIFSSIKKVKKVQDKKWQKKQ